jgi:hypothetical protein
VVGDKSKRRCRRTCGVTSEVDVDTALATAVLATVVALLVKNVRREKKERTLELTQVHWHMDESWT